MTMLLLLLTRVSAAVPQSTEVTSLISQTLFNFQTPCPQGTSLYKILLIFRHASVYCGLIVSVRECPIFTVCHNEERIWTQLFQGNHVKRTVRY
jgi:hypothetical protein